MSDQDHDAIDEEHPEERHGLTRRDVLVGGGLLMAGAGLMGDIPLFIAFVILAAFTYSSGLRAPAAIAIVKDLLIYLTAFVAVIVLPTNRVPEVVKILPDLERAIDTILPGALIELTLPA